ncbi:NADH dehydrogenase [ubiquinone] 1 alpha subcomplex subunit 6 [Halyomorpha halys]|uniref:NADH dehydrogenase [ubiquinone] 1 alpha subcomplex subunit 6 n=1 Tax=Halyomorpha halys TaxID=286706 RepID=UPI0006D5101F|nr:NADH dehydrogenase [ubiquinone] 1 alpha subcomplex subunit 6 [Halyomorpha halys]
MAASEVARKAQKLVKPILSIDNSEARRRVLNLYKTWYRQVPYIVLDFDIPKNIEQCRAKLKEEFKRNAHVQDIRVIDMLVIKGQMELKETVHGWKTKGHVMAYFKDTQEPKPEGFLNKFISGTN